MWRSAAAFALGVWREYVRIGASRSAAALSYFLILSLFPLLLCVSHLIGRFHLSLEQLLHWVAPLLPPGTADILGDYLSYVAASRSAALFWAGLAAILISSSAALRALFSAMDELFRVERRAPGRLFPSIALSCLLLGTIYLSAAVILTGRWFFGLLQLRFPAAVQALLPAARLWQWLRFGLLFCVVLLSVAIVYRTATPGQTVSHRRVLIWALAAAGAIVGCSALFSFFLGLSARYRLVYGSLAGVILLLVWLYLCGNLLLLGAAALAVSRRM